MKNQQETIQRMRAMIATKVGKVKNINELTAYLNSISQKVSQVYEETENQRNNKKKNRAKYLGSSGAARVRQDFIGKGNNPKNV